MINVNPLNLGEIKNYTIFENLSIKIKYTIKKVRNKSHTCSYTLYLAYIPEFSGSCNKLFIVTLL